MSETSQPNPAEMHPYLADHPAAEQDPARALEMAHASKGYEEHLPYLRKMTAKFIDAGDEGVDYYRGAAASGVSMAHQAAEEAGRRYDEAQK